MDRTTMVVMMITFLALGIGTCSAHSTEELNITPQEPSRVGDVRDIPCPPCKCSFHPTPHIRIVANCDGKDLTEIPQSVPYLATEISMRFNNMVVLSKEKLSLFPDIEKLNLAFNRIHLIEDSAFSENNKLLDLDMQGNILNLTVEVYRPTIFEGLRNLKTLKLNNNSKTGERDVLNGGAFANLVSLESLYIDGFNGTVFGSEFKRLSKLETLIVSGEVGYCSLGSLENDTFTYVRYVRTLNLTKCDLTRIEANAFAPLENLHTLELSKNEDLGFAMVGQAAYGLQVLPIKVLKVNFIYRRFATCVTLRKEYFQYLQNTRLLEIHMDGDRLEVFEQGALPLLPETLTTVSARYNRFTFGPYVLDLPSLKNLRYIDLSDEGVNYRIPPLPAAAVEPCTRSDDSSCSHDVEASLSPFVRRFEDKMGRPLPKYTYPVPPNLTSIKFTWKKMYYHLDEFGLTRNNLTDLDLSRNIFSEWHGPLWGMDKVVNLDLSSNFAHFINVNFFSNFSSLKRLNMSNNFFYKTLASREAGPIFSYLHSLEVLDISKNHLTHIHETVVEGLHSLKEFLCSNNKIQADFLNLSITPAQNLTLMDFSENMLETFPRHLRRSLDHMVAKNRTVRLDISHNIFSCDCGNLNFLNWLRSTKVTLLRTDEYTCKFPNGTYQSMRNLDSTIAEVERSCHSRVLLFVGVSIALLVLLLIMGALVAYRFRWKLYYLYYVARNQSRGLEAGGEEEQAFEYDAFVSFAIEDREFVHEELRVKLEQEKGIRLCLHYRDFTLGRKIADNIVESVQNSRRTVCILTPAFLESSWCKFEFEMARMESIHKDRDVVLFVLKDHVVSRALPRGILYYIKTESYLEYPRDKRCLAFFWDNLVKALRNPAHSSGYQSIP